MKQVIKGLVGSFHVRGEQLSNYMGIISSARDALVNPRFIRQLRMFCGSQGVLLVTSRFELQGYAHLPRRGHKLQPPLVHGRSSPEKLWVSPKKTRSSKGTENLKNAPEKVTEFSYISAPPPTKKQTLKIRCNHAQFHHGSSTFPGQAW